MSAKHPINVGRAYLKKKPLRLWPDLELPMALKDSHDLRKEGARRLGEIRLQAFQTTRKAAFTSGLYWREPSMPVQVGRTVAMT